MPDDDSLFEKALARQLRQRRPDNGESASVERPEGLHEDCPDAELLAAFHERTLSRDEIIPCKEHVVSCGRCQAILALLETTEDVPVSAESAEHDTVAHEPERAPRLLTPMTQMTESLGDAESQPMAMTHFARKMTASAAAAGAPMVVPVPVKRARRAAAYWLLPLGAIAAGLLVWVGVQTSTKNASRPAAVEMAQNRPIPQDAAAQPPATAPSQSPSESAPTTDQKAVTAKPASRVSVGAKPRDELGRETFAGHAPSGTTAAKTKALDKSEPPPPAPEIAALTETVQVSGQAPAPDTAPASSGANGAPRQPAPQEMNGRNFSDLNAAVEAQNAQKQAEPQPAPPVSTTAANTLGQTSASATSLMTLQAESTETKKLASMRASLVKANSSLIPAPGGKVVWRVGKAGRIEQSRDAGATWLLQTSGVIADLETGSAPSDTVCWVVGASDTILVTVDGGEHWAKITSPLATQIAGLRALDALNATVWDAAHKNTLMTSDGGVLWKRVANK